MPLYSIFYIQREIDYLLKVTSDFSGGCQSKCRCMNKVKNDNLATPLLIPYQPDEFWEQLRVIIREEIIKTSKGKNGNTYQTPGLEYKPLYKISEVCDLFHVTRPTVYDWVKHGKLRPHKIRSRVYFLWNDIQQLLVS